jgi:hypothetical protein
MRLRLTLRNMGRYRLKAATLMSVGPCGRTNFCWHGGPPLNGQPEKEGFGSLLARLTVTGQFAGKISRDWNREGLTVPVGPAGTPHDVKCWEPGPRRARMPRGSIFHAGGWDGALGHPSELKWQIPVSAKARRLAGHMCRREHAYASRQRGNEKLHRGMSSTIMLPPFD